MMSTMDFEIVGIVVALLAIVLTILLYLFYWKSRVSRRVVMLTGLCGSGKTLLFSRLIHNQYVSTHVSIMENSSEYDTEKGSLTIVDIPGHERLREKYIDQYKKTSRALVFVIDSVTFQKEMQDVAEFLHIILTDPMVVSNCNNVLILCNKQDLAMAKGNLVIKALLEKELNTVRMTKSSQLTSTEDTGVKSVFLGQEDVDFEFSQCPMNVSFAECHALNSNVDAEPDIESLQDWLTAIA